MDPVVKHLDYTCPLCGEKAVAGSHFCEGKAATGPSGSQKKLATQSLPLVLLISLVLLVTLVWHWVGPASLLVAALGLFLWFLRKK